MSWTADNIPRANDPRPHYIFAQRSPRTAKVYQLEFMIFCIRCKDRYGPVCKYCDLDGTCSFHGIVFENGECPICGNTFEEDWDRYIDYRDKFERGLI